MAAVECRNRQNIHESKSHRQECRDIPESDPVPFLGEDGAYRAEAADAVGSLLCEDHLHRLGIGSEFLGAHLDAARNRLENIIMYILRVEESRGIHLQPDAHFRAGREGHGFFESVAAFAVLSHHGEADGAVLMAGEGGEEEIDRGRGHAVDGDNLIARLNARFGRSFARHDLSDSDRDAVGEEIHHSRVALGLVVKIEDELLGD